MFEYMGEDQHVERLAEIFPQVGDGELNVWKTLPCDGDLGQVVIDADPSSRPEAADDLAGATAELEDGLLGTNLAQQKIIGFLPEEIKLNRVFMGEPPGNPSGVEHHIKLLRPAQRKPPIQWIKRRTGPSGAAWCGTIP